MNILYVEKSLELLGNEKLINYGLENFKEALRSLGNPEKSVQSLIIGGTNGKGTTTLLVSSVLRSAGHRVATYLSPHLQSPCERLLLNLEAIEEREISELVQEFYSVAQKFSLSYFEFLTLIYFVWAKRQRADFLVLEVGLGGRLDATNVTDPLACAVTNIAFDHQQLLGNTLSAILNEKLGILNPEGLLFTGIEERELLDLVEQRCSALDSIFYYSKEIKQKVTKLDEHGLELTLNGYPFSIQNPSVGALKSAALAFLITRIAFPRISLETIRTGFGQVVNPGRMEVIQHSPRVILSGDHNPSGIECLQTNLAALAPHRLKILCAFSPDKPYREMLNRLKEITPNVVVTECERYAGKMGKDYYSIAEFRPNARGLLESMVAQSDEDETILVTGSLYLVGEVRSLWHRKANFLKARQPSAERTSRSEDVARETPAHSTEVAQNFAR